MAVETDAMRLDLLQDFGSSSTFTDTSEATSSTVTVILTNEFFAADPGGSVVVQSSEPIAVGRSIDLPSIAQGDTLAISGTTYTIVEVEPDNEGMIRVRMRTCVTSASTSARRSGRLARVYRRPGAMFSSLGAIRWSRPEVPGFAFTP